MALIPVLRELFDGRTVLVVDHDIHWVHQLCDRYVILEDGQTQQFEDRDSVVNDSPLFAELLRADPSE